jgi:hypothetical protein
VALASPPPVRTRLGDDIDPFPTLRASLQVHCARRHGSPRAHLRSPERSRPPEEASSRPKPQSARKPP